MTIAITTSDSRRVRHLQGRVPTMARQYGWPSDHPAIAALVAEPTKLSGYDDHSLGELLNPRSAQNVCTVGGRKLVLTPFGRNHGPTPIDIANRLLPTGWEERWIGIVLESNTVIFIGKSNEEIIRFHGAGCGNRAVLKEARYLLVHYMFQLLPDVSHLGLMAELDKLTASLKVGDPNFAYNRLKFVNGPHGWELIPG